jgi:hypothetical protein
LSYEFAGHPLEGVGVTGLVGVVLVVLVLVVLVLLFEGVVVTVELLLPAGILLLLVVDDEASLLVKLHAFLLVG